MGGRFRKAGRGIGLVAAALVLSFMFASGVAAVSGPPRAAPSLHPELWPKAHSPDALPDRVTEGAIRHVMAGLTVEEKVAQTIQADIGAFLPDDFAHYPLGGILAGGTS